MFSLAKLITPFSNRTKEIDVAQTWEVRWESRDGPYSHDTKPEMEILLSEQAANEFAEALRNAFRLIRHTSGTKVEIKKRPQIL